MPKNHYERWTDKDINEAVELAANGVTHADIARILGRSTSSINSVVHRERNKRASLGKPVNGFEEPSILGRIKMWLGIGR